MVSVSVEKTSEFWRWVSRFDWLALWFGRICKAGAGLCIAYVFCCFIAGVIMRPWNGFVFSFAYETSTLVLWPISFLALANIWRTQGHMRFDLFLRKTRYRKHHVLLLIGSLAAFAVSVAFAWQAVIMLAGEYRAQTTTLTFQYTIWPFYAAVPIGSIALAVELVASALRDLKEVLSPTGSEREVYAAFDSDAGGL